MSREKEFIRKMVSVLPRSENQFNACFESDAEILAFGNANLMFSVDSFSEEDFFSSKNPFVLGWNLAVATISDLLASGGSPLYYGHSLTCPLSVWGDTYLTIFSSGIADALRQCKAYFIGGDLGSSDNWSYTGIILGTSHKWLTRTGATPGDFILMTGETGAFNAEACWHFFGKKNHESDWPTLLKTRLQLRYKESCLIREYANCCTDTSDGVGNALMDVSSLNGTGFRIRTVPYIEHGISVMDTLSMPVDLLFLGECGEYELLFTLNPEYYEAFFEVAVNQGLKFHTLGRINKNSVKCVENNGHQLDMEAFDIRARDFDDPYVYVDALIAYIQNHEHFSVK